MQASTIHHGHRTSLANHPIASSKNTKITPKLTIDAFSKCPQAPTTTPIHRTAAPAQPQNPNHPTQRMLPKSPSVRVAAPAGPVPKAIHTKKPGGRPVDERRSTIDAGVRRGMHDCFAVGSKYSGVPLLCKQISLIHLSEPATS